MKYFDRVLFVYTTVFSAVVLVMALMNRSGDASSLVMALLFLPVLGFLGVQIVQGIYQRRFGVAVYDERPKSELQKIKAKYQDDDFVPVEVANLKYFFSQRTPSFLFTMLLLTLATSATIYRSMSSGIVMQHDSGVPDSDLVWPVSNHI